MSHVGSMRYTAGMSRESLVLILGIVVSSASYLGVPSEWKEWIIAISGLVLIALGYSLRRTAFFRSIEVVPGERRSEAFVEHKTTRSSDTLSI
ncbi:MAG: hypothetical protein RLZZ234_220 [Candidatus Parcubacteria bacterium]